MSKKKKSQKPKKTQVEIKKDLDSSLIENEELENEELEAEEVEIEEESVKKEENTAPKGKDKNDKKKSNKKKIAEKGRVKRMVKESVSEIKNVVWPSFGEVVKRTGIVLVVVLVFAVVIFGIDTGLGALVKLLKK